MILQLLGALGLSAITGLNTIQEANYTNLRTELNEDSTTYRLQFNSFSDILSIPSTTTNDVSKLYGVTHFIVQTDGDILIEKYRSTSIDNNYYDGYIGNLYYNYRSGDYGVTDNEVAFCLILRYQITLTWTATGQGHQYTPNSISLDTLAFQYVFLNQNYFYGNLTYSQCNFDSVCVTALPSEYPYYISNYIIGNFEFRNLMYTSGYKPLDEFWEYTRYVPTIPCGNYNWYDGNGADDEGLMFDLCPYIFSTEFQSSHRLLLLDVSNAINRLQSYPFKCELSIYPLILDQNEAYSQGVKDGQQIGYNNGYTDGYNAGYSDGFDYSSGVNNTAVVIFTGIIDIALLPINFFLACLNFEVFGINIGAFVTSLLTVAIVFILFRMIFSGGNGKND